MVEMKMRTPSSPQHTKVEYARALIYEAAFDPILRKIRRLVADLIPNGSKVIVIGCGPGTLSIQLAKSQNCTVQGIDLAPGKIARAINRGANNPNIHFAQADATHLPNIADGDFDYATMTLFLHALPEEIRLQVLQEAMRVAHNLVIADYVTPPPKSIYGLAVTGIERFGEHRENFNSFQANGGLDPLLETAGLTVVKETLNPSKTVRILIGRPKRI